MARYTLNNDRSAEKCKTAPDTQKFASKLLATNFDSWPILNTLFPGKWSSFSNAKFLFYMSRRDIHSCLICQRVLVFFPMQFCKWPRAFFPLLDFSQAKSENWDCPQDRDKIPLRQFMQSATILLILLTAIGRNGILFEKKFSSNRAGLESINLANQDRIWELVWPWF